MPVRQSLTPMYSEAFNRVVAAAFKTNPAAALAPTLKCRLIQEQDFEPTPASVEADYEAVEADFTDYAEATVTLIEPANVGSDVEGCIASVTFNMTTDPTVTSNTIFGYFLISGTDLVVMAEMFPAGQGVVMAAPGDFLTINLALPLNDYQSVSGD